MPSLLFVSDDVGYIYGNMTSSEVTRFENYRTSYRILGPPLMGFVGLVCLVSGYSLWRKRCSSNKTLVRWIFLSTLFSLLTQSLVYMQMFTNWQGRNEGCRVSPSAATVTYVLANTAVYLFLHTRATAAVYGFSLTKRLLKVLLVVTYCSPLFCLTAFFLISGDVILMEDLEAQPHICTFSIKFWATLLFMLTDTTLSVGYLIVFIIPVYNAMWKTKNLTASERSDPGMIRLLRQNLLASSVAILSTFTAMTLLSYGFARVEQEKSGPDLLFSTWTYPLITVDVTINTISMISITSVWIPTNWVWLKKAHGRVFSPSKEPTSSLASSHRGTSENQRSKASESAVVEQPSFLAPSVNQSSFNPPSEDDDYV